MSLRLRLALVVGSTFAVVVIGCIYAAHVSASHGLRNEVDHFLTQRANDPFIQGEGPIRPPGGDIDDTGTHGAKPDVYVQLLNADGSTRYQGSVKLPIDETDRQIAAGSDERSRFRTVSVDGASYRVLTVRTPDGAAQIARSIAEADDVLSTLDLRLVLIAVAGTLAAALLAWLIARRVVRPIERLTGATEHVAVTQDLANTITVDRRDEIGRLAESFNTMLVALRMSRDQQQRLVVDASHELRTPLTALRTNIEVLQRRADMNDADRSELLGAVEGELHELTALVAELVDLATDSRSEETPQPTDIGELAERVVQRYERRAQHPVTLAVDHPAVVEVRPLALERALSNLVDNACKFSTNGQAVEVRVTGSTLEVLDRGPGIPAEDRPHVFDRFYRSPTARTMPGSGLGLSIVQQVVDMHGGTVALLARDGGGTVARITLPS